MRWMRLGLIILLAATPAVRAQEPAAKIDFAPLEKQIDDELKSSNTPGAAFAIVLGDKVALRKGFGLANVETNEAMTPERLFRLGSTTKMFVAATLASLAKDGKLKLDEPIGKHVKGLPEKLNGLTPYQLLSHTAGITDEAPMFGLHDDEALGKGIRGWKDDYLFARPGQVFSYSNPSYWLAGLVAEEVGRKPFADVVEERMFQPLGMRRTTFRPTMAMTYPLALGHELRNGKPAIVRPMGDNTGSWPAGSIFSNVDDLARFAIAFLNDGSLDGKQAIDPAIFRTISEPRVKVPTSGSHYGLGITNATLRGVKVLEHTGSRSGYGSLIRFLPERKGAIIVLINKTGGALPLSVEKATDLLAPLAARKAPNPKGTEFTKDELEKLKGVYSNNRQKSEIVLEDGKPILKSGAASQPIRKIEEGRYSAGAATFTLTPGMDGKDLFLTTGVRSLKKQP